jgi:iron complex transport system substrate-binding protein
MLKKHLAIICLLLMIMTLISSGCGTPSNQPSASGNNAAVGSKSAKREVVDGYGRRVMVPADIKSVAPVGSYPVILSFILAVGEGDKVTCGLPGSFSKTTYKYDLVFAPQLVTKPVVQNTQKS